MPTTDEHERKAAHQRQLVAHLRDVPAYAVREAELALHSSGPDERLAWAVLRLATERPQLWDAMAQLAQVHLLVSAVEAEGSDR